jgi:hypothetical protein
MTDRFECLDCGSILTEDYCNWVPDSPYDPGYWMCLCGGVDFAEVRPCAYCEDYIRNDKMEPGTDLCRDCWSRQVEEEYR